MKKADPHYSYYCGWCDKEFGNSPKPRKEIPKKVICPECGTAGAPVIKQKPRKAVGRNYPNEYFENQ